MHTKQSIIELLLTNDKAIARALVVLNDRQTADEQASGATIYHNGRGFSGAHSTIGTSMAKFYQKNGFLTTRQLEYWRKPTKSGRPRITIYAGQLLEEATAKEALKVTTEKIQPIQSGGRDLGNDMERKAVLQEQLGDVIDSDMPELIDPIANEIDEIDEFWNKIQALHK